jgi:hypothetical protein
MAKKHQRTLSLFDQMHSNTICFDEPMGWRSGITVTFFSSHMYALNSKHVSNGGFMSVSEELGCCA